LVFNQKKIGSQTCEICRSFSLKIQMSRENQLKHSSKYAKLIRDIRKYKIVQATGRVFSMHGYTRHGVHLKQKSCQILFRKVGKYEPHGILYSEDYTRVDIIHDFENMDNIFNKHRINSDGEGSVEPQEFFSRQHVFGKGYFSDDEDEEDNGKTQEKKIYYDDPVFVSSYSVFEQYLTDALGVFVIKWNVPTK